MGLTERLDRYCSPVSTLWKSSSCYDNQTSCHDQVDFTLCFEDIVILIPILLIFWCLTGITFLGGSSGYKVSLHFNLLHAIKLFLVLVVLLTGFSDLFYTVDEGRRGVGVATFQYLSPSLLVITMVIVALVLYRDRIAGHHTSGLLFTFWLVMTLYGAFKLQTYILMAMDTNEVKDVFRLSTFCFQFVTYLLQLLLSVFPEPHIKRPDQGTERPPCPEEDATFLSQITWWWQTKQIWEGWRRPLVYDNLADLCYKDKSKVVAERFQRHWNQEVKNSGVVFTHHNTDEEGNEGGETKTPKLSFEMKNSNSVEKRGAVRWKKLTTTSVQLEEKEKNDDQVMLITEDALPSKKKGCCSKKGPSLLLVIGKTFWKPLLSSAFFKLLQDLLGFVGPQLLKQMIRFTQDVDQPDWLGYVYAILLFVSVLLQSLFLHQYFHRVYLMGMNIRTAIISAVYSKALRMSNKSRQVSTVGEIVNLMSIDAQRFMDLMTHLHIMWSAPFQITLALIFLYLTMGPSIFAGFVVMVFMIPFNGFLGSMAHRLQVKVMSTKDSRIKLINEVLNGIKVIKLYAWELPFKNLIRTLRNRELNVLKKSAYLNSTVSFSWTCAPIIVAFVTFATYSLVHANDPDNRLTPDKVFVAIALFALLRFPLTMLPVIVTTFIQASVSLKRLSKFLQNEELDPNDIEWIPEPELGKDGYAMKMSSASFTWETDHQNKDLPPTLNNLNLEVKPGQLVAVVGQVGAGKSSLIQAVLGEMEKLEGRVTLKGSIAYVPQQAWIQNATLKDNVLFGKKLDEYSFQKTIHGCALEPDLEMLPGGVMTEIGEKGINLSGGQKQRVSLARAVYQDTDIYLLDDPLSAVDSHVGKHIFDKVIGPEGVLKNKVRLLVTHGVSFLPQCDQIVVIVGGKITEVGSYTELVANNGAFAEFLQTYSKMDLDEGETPDENNSPEHRTDLTEHQVTAKTQQTQQPLEGKASEKPRKTSELITEEEAKTGRVHFSVLVAYCKACSWLMVILTMFMFSVTYISSVSANFWLAAWSNAESRATEEEGNFSGSTACDGANGTIVGCYLGIYGLFGVMQSIFVLCSSFSITIASYLASKRLHKNMLNNIFRSPMAFFDTTPMGRILNRFSKDIDVIDMQIPRAVRSFLMTVLTVLSTIIVICIATPIFLAVIIPMGIIYALVQRLYVATSRQLKRLESITRSPIYSHFQETLLGVASIRAYRQQERFILESEKRVDFNQIAYYPSICANRWLAIRLEFLGNLAIFFAAFFAAIYRNYSDELSLSISPGLVGLSVSYALQITQCLSCVVRMSSELETNIVAVERTKEYAETPTEAPPVIKDYRPSPEWPNKGEVLFDNYSTRYRQGLDLVLQDISVKIPGGTKVGIVGRTGAGKSSLTLALLRIIESAGGVILVDGVNIADYGLDDLRSRITIIPQDPVLFSGSLRLNLDPFEEYKDEELWRALECAHLSTFVSGLQEGLQHTIAEGGENLSVGQCQLICLARALLRKTKILVLDEATAAVDLETDDLIQKTIRTEFSTCTVITIAHRLNTIMDYDKIMLLDGGRIQEFASPKDLLADENSRFYSMARDSGLV